MIGTHISDLPPSPQNRRNSEGAFIRLNSGEILFVYSRFGGDTSEDYGACDLYGILSQDNGDHFGMPFPVLCHKEVGADNVMSVSLMRMRNGDVGMFYLRKQGNHCMLYFVRSADETRTWSKPICVLDKEGYYVHNNDRAVMLSNGRILLPLAYHHTLDALAPGKLVVVSSEDDGYTWQTIAQDVGIPASRGLTTGVQEPGILELADGTLWCYARTDAGRHYESFSFDGGYTWSAFLPSPFTAPASPLSAKRLCDGRIVAIWNPIPAYYGRAVRGDGVYTDGRSPLVLAISADDGKTFATPIPIETDERAGYCYTAIFETDDALLLAYCAGGPGEKTNLARLRIRKIAKDEL